MYVYSQYAGMRRRVVAVLAVDCRILEEVWQSEAQTGVATILYVVLRPVWRWLPYLGVIVIIYNSELEYIQAYKLTRIHCRTTLNGLYFHVESKKADAYRSDGSTSSTPSLILIDVYRISYKTFKQAHNVVSITSWSVVTVS